MICLFFCIFFVCFIMSVECLYLHTARLTCKYHRVVDFVFYVYFTCVLIVLE